MTRSPARLDGRTVLVTGATAGVGYHAAERLAGLGATVVLAGRDPGRVRRAVGSVTTHVPGARVRAVPLDLASLASVRDAAAGLRAEGPVDVVVANAGAVALPEWSKPRAERGYHPRTTADGVELFWGTNHLGHFALVAHLLPDLLARGGRVVHVGSLIHSRAVASAGSLPLPEDRQTDLAKYARSKLAVMSFGFELARRLEAAGASASSVVAHPGTAVDVLSPSRDVGVNQPMPGGLSRLAVRAFAHGKDAGAACVVAAVAGPDAHNGDYWGPHGWGQLRGGPVRRTPHAKALDPDAAQRLVALSESLAGVRLPV